MKEQPTKFLTATLGLLAIFSLATPLYAVDGVIEINQARALAGGITPGDTPDFPVTISESGSYRLTGNLNPPFNRTAVEITRNSLLNARECGKLSGCVGAFHWLCFLSIFWISLFVLGAFHV